MGSRGVDVGLGPAASGARGAASGVSLLRGPGVGGGAPPVDSVESRGPEPPWKRVTGEAGRGTPTCPVRRGHVLHRPLRRGGATQHPGRGPPLRSRQGTPWLWAPIQTQLTSSLRQPQWLSLGLPVVTLEQ